MTESIKFGPEWLRNSVANVSSSSGPNSAPSNAPPSENNTMIARPVLSDHRYGREEMLSLCDKSTRLPDVLTRFRRLFVPEWQTPLALQPNTEDERGLGASTAWGPSHIRPLIPGSGMGRGGAGIIRGGSIERGRGRGRGLYHGSAGYTRSTSMYDEDGRRTNLWLDRNGTETSEWSGSGSTVSPRKEYSRGIGGGMENWRKGTRDESGGAGGEVDWRSSNNGTAPTREKWARSTSWREGDSSNDSGPPNGGQQQSSSPPTGGGINQVPSSAGPSKAPALYKKSWDEDHLPEWATESFDYGGTFDSSGAFHQNDGERDLRMPDDAKHEKMKAKMEVKKDEPVMEENETLEEPPQPPMNHFDGHGEPPSMPIKFMNLMNDRESQQNANFNPNAQIANFNGAVSQHPSTHIDRMQEVADLVANLIMEDDVKDVKAPVVVPGPPVAAAQPPLHVDWFYRDPQGDTQGPFTAQDMSEWYKAGYFRESLMVRRSIDGAFMPLGQLVKVYGLSAPFMAATMMEPLQPPPPPPPVELDAFRMQHQQHHQQQQQQRMVPPVDGWNGMTPEQQIAMLNMRMVQQRPPVPDPFVKQAPPANVPGHMDLRRMMGTGPTEFYQAPGPANVLPTALPQQEMDPIQQLLMQLQKTGNGGGGVMNDPNQWMKQPNLAAPPQMMIPASGNNLEMISQPVINQQQQQIPTALNPNQAPPQNNWNQTPMSIWDMPKEEKLPPNVHQMQRHQNSSHNQDIDGLQNGIGDDSSLQFQTAPMKSHDAKKKKQKEDEKAQEQKKQMKEPAPKQNAAAAKKKPNEKQQQQQKKEERSTQPAAPAPWVGHQTTSNGTSLAKIQKTEAQRRQGELAAQRERDHQKLEMMQKMEMQKNDGLKWAAPPAPRVKTLDEIQAEEATAAAIHREREAVMQAKRDAAKKESSIVTNDVSIWNSTPHSMAWQQPKQWSGEQQSGSGFWEEPTKPSNPSGGKNAQLLSKSQTMATITTTKKQPPAQAKRQQPPKKPMGEKREKKDDNNNEFTSWCTKTLSSMNGNVDVPTFVSFLQDIESPFEVKDYIKMYLGESKECLEFSKQFLERRSKQRNQQRLQNAHIDDMCSPAPAITPSVNSISTEFQEVKGKNKKVKAKKVMKAVDGRMLLGFTATSASDRINVGDRDYGDA